MENAPKEQGAIEGSLAQGRERDDRPGAGRRAGPSAADQKRKPVSIIARVWVSSVPAEPKPKPGVSLSILV